MPDESMLQDSFDIFEVDSNEIIYFSNCWAPLPSLSLYSDR